jgi:hypothetical protein
MNPSKSLQRGDLVRVSLDDDWSLFQITEVTADRINIVPLNEPLNSSALVLLDGQWRVEQAEDVPYQIVFGHFPKHLSHVTSLNSLYIILSSGQIISRAKTGVAAGFSSATKGDPKYVYLSLDVQTPLVGNVKLVISPQILLDRSDYFLNADWYYGVTSESLRPDQLIDWLHQVKGPGEILFPDSIDLDPYLQEIVVPQLEPGLVAIIRKSNPQAKLTVLEMDRIPDKYKDLIKVVY